MKSSSYILTVALFPLALAACGDAGEEHQAAPEATASAPAPDQTPAPTVAPTPLPTSIPVAIQGRWGLVPADCTSTAGDAKGLLTISDRQLRFYESVGTLGGLIEGEETRIRGNFSFTGEGMTWEREQVLDVQDDGQTLVRREFGMDAAPGALRYTKCP